MTFLEKVTKLNILHVGFPKSASTSIQWNLFAHCHNHIYISRVNNGAPEEYSFVYNAISEALLSGSHIKSSAGTLISSTGEKPFIFSDERMLLPYGRDRTTLIYRAVASRQIFNEVKVLLVVRNPIDQLISLYKHIMIQHFRNFEKLPRVGFSDWLGFPSEHRFQLRGDVTQSAYFGRLIAKYCELYGRNNVHVIFFENLIRDGKDGYVKLAEELNLGDYHQPEEMPPMNITSDKYYLKKVSRTPGSNFNLAIKADIESRLYDIIQSESKILERHTGLHPPDQWFNPAR